MSSQNSILAGIAGAAVSSAVWFFAGNTASSQAIAANTETTKNDTEAMAYAIQVPCPQQLTHAITWTRAQELVSSYLATGNARQLITDNNRVLKGWYLDKCIIENLFDSYPDADGLQLYIGRDTLEDKTLANQLVWMASQMVVNAQGVRERENCISTINTVMDLTQPCPNNCPTKNDLP